MRYDKERDVFVLTGREFIATARSGIAESLPPDEDEPTFGAVAGRILQKGLGTEQSKELTLLLSTEACRFEVTLKAFETTDGLGFAQKTSRNPEKPTKEELSQVRGEAFLCALAEKRKSGEIPVLTYLFYREETDTLATRSEKPTEGNLSAFVEKCLTVTEKYAAPAMDRAKNRLPSFKTMKFPFSKIRDGQETFMSSVYRTVMKGSKLFAEAPTGTGKTVSALFPAVRAMGEGKGEKIFYLTPKTTVSAVVADTIYQMKNAGADVLSVIMTAKEKTCKCGLVCRKSKDLCAFSSCNHMADAVLYLFREHLPVVDFDKLEEIAKLFCVCPYELSLSYAQLADVVICDYNYLFDPVVYFHRFFEENGDYVFLIDEAHTLADRAGAMYSDELTEKDFACDISLPELSPLRRTLTTACEDMKTDIFTYLKNDTVKESDGTVIGAAHTKQFPTGFYSILSEIVDSAEKELYEAYGDKTEAGKERVFAAKNIYYRFSKFYKLASALDERYEIFLFRENDSFRFKLFCLDPSKRMTERLEKGRAAIFFSATLSPVSYYKSILGGNRQDETLSLPSPFVKEQLSVVILDNIATRLSERERTGKDVIRVIAATLSAKRGHYIVFTPSFAYAEMLAKLFAAKYPKIRLLLQKRGMSEKEKTAFLAEFQKEDDAYLLGFCVMGGLFSEGIDLTGKSLIGSIVVGVGLPEISYEREAARAYFDDKYEMGRAFAYIYPGMNKVLQAAGRVIREETDRGVIVLIDDRFQDPIYKKAIPELWHGLKFVNHAGAVKMLFEQFWKENS